MTETDKAWLAGIVDGEGCIYAYVEKSGYLKSALQVIMTDYATIKHLHDLSESGMEPRPQKAGPSNRHKAWRWSPQAQNAAAILRDIEPYMVTKRHQAKIFIELMSMRGLDKKNNDLARQYALVDELKAAKYDGMIPLEAE